MAGFSLSLRHGPVRPSHVLSSRFTGRPVNVSHAPRGNGLGRILSPLGNHKTHFNSVSNHYILMVYIPGRTMSYSRCSGFQYVLVGVCLSSPRRSLSFKSSTVCCNRANASTRGSLRTCHSLTQQLLDFSLTQCLREGFYIHFTLFLQHVALLSCTDQHVDVRCLHGGEKDRFSLDSSI